MKRRNRSWGCKRIAQQLALAFGVDIDKDVVRRILAMQARAAIPARRSGEATEAAAAVWLCSAEASYIFGQMLVVDGGMTVGGFEF